MNVRRRNFYRTRLCEKKTKIDRIKNIACLIYYASTENIYRVE